MSEASEMARALTLRTRPESEEDFAVEVVVLLGRLVSDVERLEAELARVKRVAEAADRWIDSRDASDDWDLEDAVSAYRRGE